MLERNGFERYEAYMFLSLTCRVKVCQVVNPLYTVEVSLPKKYIEKILD